MKRLRRWAASAAGGSTQLLVASATVLLAALWLAAPAQAVKPISVVPDQDRIEITSLGELYDSRGDSLQIETAADGGVVVGRMTVRAVTPGSNPAWIAFALHNGTDKPIERWLTAERYTMFGSGAVWPDLDARRLEALTPSIGFVPERIRNDRADIFRITIEAGQTITYVAELSGERFARVYLWKPIDYELKARERQLLNGVLLGLTGLSAIFLTAVFAANHKAIFPAAALVAWCVLAHLTVDFGFFHKLFQLKAEDNAVYRAATEAAIAASLVIFLNTFLRLNRAPSLLQMLLGLWIAGQIALVAIAVIDPRLASTFARISFAVIAVVGALTTGFLALRNEDRALSLVPMWILFVVWVLGAAVILTGRLANDIAASGLIAGLVLIVLLIGFIVTQFAFRSQEPAYPSGFGGGNQQLSALAVEASGAGILEWTQSRNEFKVSPIIEGILGLPQGSLSTKFAEFMKFVHEADRERLRLALSSVQSRPGAALTTQFRLRHADNSSRWFEVEAASLPGSDPRSSRFVGLIRDVTETRRAHERLVHDAVYCSLTGIANRPLFLDRLAHVMERARSDETLRPAIILIDLDRFRSINTQHGMPVGDSLLLTIARRLQRHVSRTDLLARIGSDRFAILIEDERQPQDYAREAEQIRRAVRAPIRIDQQEIVVTGSLGIAIFDGTEDAQGDLLDAAEVAVARAKQGGADRIELYRPELRADRGRKHDVAADLEKALEKGAIRIVYQPIIYLPTEELAGFEASVRYDHPELGTIDPFELDVPSGSDILARVFASAIGRASKDAARWQADLPRNERPLFLSFNVTSARLFRPELGREVRRILDHAILPKGSLRLEIGEAMVMENPEQASEILELLHGVGAELTLDGFGAGFSGLAYLGHLPFDTVKLDRALVQAAGGGETGSASIVRSLVAMSLELGKKVVADGVEDPEAVAFLRGIGCVFAQGFYYGDPMPDREVLQLLKLVRKAERSMQPHGMFRMSLRKSKRAQASPAGGSSPANGGEAGKARSEAKSTAKPGRVKRRQGADRGEREAPPPAHSQPSPPLAPPPPASFAGHGHPQMPAPDHGFTPPPHPGAPEIPYHANGLGNGYGYPEAHHPAQRIDMPYDHPTGAFDDRPGAGPENMSSIFGGEPNIVADPVATLAAAVADHQRHNGQPPQQPPPLQAETVFRPRPARAAPDFSKLPPGLAASLAKLANTTGATGRPVDPRDPPTATLPDGRPSTIPSLSAVRPNKRSDPN